MEILIADDNNIAPMRLGSTLTRLGRDVHEATHGRAWNAGRFPIVSDWMMPGHTGLEFWRRIRAELQWPDPSLGEGVSPQFS
jgi:CheY-like chemotaxis protein